VSVTLTHAVKELGAELDPVFEALQLAMYLVDTSGVVRWQNAAAIELTGDIRGTRLARIVAPEFRRRAEESMARQFLGAEREVVVESAALGQDGKRIRVHVRRIALEGEHGVVGILGIARPVGPGTRADVCIELPPRQHEALRLLARGLSTDEIAAELGVARETARNYIRRLLQSLGVHSRLEAVVRARELDLI
jgi:PAS domain S-box-containing protein